VLPEPAEIERALGIITRFVEKSWIAVEQAASSANRYR
jgi:hypothetical protein